jgi:hypothetical protein
VTPRITTFQYDSRWGGGYGWIIWNDDCRGAFATSEKQSRTPENARKAAERWWRRHGAKEST